jgi:hypothetical protein
MSTIRNPVGPQPPQVYWRRRLVVGILFVAVVIAIILIVVSCTNGRTPTGGTGTNTPKPSNSSTAPSTNSGDAEACDPAKVTVEAVTDAAGYDPGVNPQLSLVVKSTETVPCTLEVGTDVQEFTITSGDEVIWKSSDCQVDPAPRTQLLQPGVPVSSAAIAWDRTRSSPDTCDAQREQVTGGGASYHLEVSIGDLKSGATKQFLLY